MTEHHPPWPADKPPHERGLYQGYERWTVEANVRKAFMAKYGYPPRHVHRTGGCVLAGPIREEP